MKTFSLRTTRRAEMVDITREVAKLVSGIGVKEGAAVVYIPHTTAGVTINENADPDVVRDILATLEKIVPRDGDYRHGEGNSDAHLKSAFLGHSVTIPVSGGLLALGAWQGIYFCEFDGPRTREVKVQVVKGNGGRESGGRG
ncbi:MAG: secondary thiamine-phosphate synthase enzyme YjbQ [Planctomycetota bacterium]